MTIVDRATTRFSAVNRRRKGEYVRRYMADNGIRSVLFVGCGGAWDELAQIVERAAASQARFVAAADLHTHIDAEWPYVRCDGLSLPFPDQAFDLVLSNAVIEHIGDEAAQHRFVSEHLRVGRHYIVTTPNRWFPVESHTRQVLLHWLPAWRARQGDHFTRLLSRDELKALLPPGGAVTGGLLAATLTAAGRSNPAPADAPRRPSSLPSRRDVGNPASVTERACR